jgi:hypothetical protein
VQETGRDPYREERMPGADTHGLRMMTTGTGLFLFLLLALLLLAGGWFLSGGMACRDPEAITVSTDRGDYSPGEMVHVSIVNTGDRPVDIYCPSLCALGNFPTMVERLVDGRWEYAAGFCPSIGSPLENRGTVDGDFIRHSLPPGGSFQLELSNFEALRLTKEEKFRIVYSLCGGREPVYSSVFTLRP